MPPESNPENKNPFFELIKKIWLPITGILSAVVFIYQFIEIWQGDTQTISVIFAVIGLAVWVTFLSWLGFSNVRETHEKLWPIGAKETIIKPRYPQWQWGARITLAITIVGILVSGGIWQNQQETLRQENQKKVIVIIARFDGPEETYGLRNQILEQLNLSVKGYEEIKIIPLDETITIAQGAEYARQLGERYQADLVIWGWYRPTENPNLTLHIENLSPAKVTALKASATYNLQASIADLESFSLQQKIGEQTSSLVLSLSGILLYQSGNYEEAIRRLDESINTDLETYDLLDNSIIYFYRGNAYLILADNGNGPEKNSFEKIKEYRTKAVEDLTKSIQLRPDFLQAYFDRALGYMSLNENEKANTDWLHFVTELHPNSVSDYVNRSIAYTYLNKINEAMNELNSVIKSAPQDAEWLQSIYLSRSALYSLKGEYEKSIADLTFVINNYQDETGTAHFNRAVAYQILGRPEKAIDDLNYILRIYERYPQDSYRLFKASVYETRGDAYADKNNYQKAIEDYTHAVQLSNIVTPLALYKRGLVHLKKEDYKNAIDDFTKALEHYAELYNEEGTVDIYYQRGIAYRAIGDKPKSEADLKLALDGSMFYGTTYLDQATSADNTMQAILYGWAITDFSRAIEIDPNNIAAYYLRAQAYRFLSGNYFENGNRQEMYNHIDKAIKDLSMVINMNSEFADAYYERGLAYLLISECEKGHADFRKTVELTDDPKVRIMAESLSRAKAPGCPNSTQAPTSTSTP